MTCKNCHNTLQEKSDYCNSCGAKVIRNRLTIKNLLASFGEQFLNYDNKFFQTFISLFRKPEDVIGSYIEGTRKKYVNVISYYAIAITFAGLQLFVLNKYFPEALDMSSLAVNEAGEEFQKMNLAFMQEYQSLMMVLYVPVYALISRLVFFNIKKFNYTEHLVIFMYILAQLSIIGTVLTIIGGFTGFSLGNLTIIILPLQVIYSAYCLKRLYGLNFGELLVRTVLFLAISMVLLIIIVILFYGILFLVLGKEGFLEFMKSMQPKTG